jgi:hypothetical protein
MKPLNPQMIAAMAEGAERSFSADWLIFQNGGFLKARPRSLSAGSTWREGLLSAVSSQAEVLPWPLYQTEDRSVLMGPSNMVKLRWTPTLSLHESPSASLKHVSGMRRPPGTKARLPARHIVTFSVPSRTGSVEGKRIRCSVLGLLRCACRKAERHSRASEIRIANDR